MATHLVWFRNDLRLTDNTALHHACQDSDASVLAVYIATPKQWQTHHMSARQAWLIEQHVKQLSEDLSALNIPLIYHETNDFASSIELIESICRQHNVTDIFYNIQYEWNERKRDEALVKQLGNLQIHAYDDAVLFAPGQLVNGSGDMYQIYTPFKKKCIERFIGQSNTVFAKPKKRKERFSVDSSAIKPFSYQTLPAEQIPVGEEKALACLKSFCQKHVDRYLLQRDFPDLDATSRLSVYLNLGVLSVRQCVARLHTEYPDFLQQTSSGAFGWFGQLIWREFYIHLLYMFPKLSKNKPFIDWTSRINWQHSPKQLEAWKNGLTGYPIVDAGMRQLNQTGWMHNRLRMITASFLVKDLLIDWHYGENYFMSQLIDGDLALNNGGWQWAASTGTDAAPYFRIFNPTTQGERFDNKGQFIRKYLPELKQVPDEFIHQPHKWAKANNLKLNYPEPIVNHTEARNATLAAFKSAK